jgi:HPt (histidine-containing phosphotransfer) domain-containing protein
MKITRKQLRRLIMEVVVASDDVKQKASDLEDSLKTDNPDASDEEIEAAIDKLTEELEKLPSYAYYDYGIDQVPNKTDAHEDIIGHT